MCDVRLSELTEKYIPRTLFAWKTIAVTVEEVCFEVNSSFVV